MWPLLAMGGLSLLQQNQQRKQQKIQNQMDIQASAIQIRERALDHTAESKAIQDANQRNFQASAFRVGMLNVQKAQEVRALEQRRFETISQEQSALGTAAVNAAASGTIGASVDAVQSDIQMAFDRMRGQINEENELNALNYNTALYDLVTEGQNQLVTASEYRRSEVYKPQKLISGWGMLGNAAMSVGGMYLSQRMDLGLGPQPKAAPARRV